MRAVMRLLLSLTIAAGYLGSLGCGKDNAKNNADLKVPDVPPSGRGDKSPAGKGPGKKF